MIYHIDNTRDNGSEDRIVHVDATFVMSWQIAHDYIFAEFSKAIDCVGGWVGGRVWGWI